MDKQIILACDDQGKFLEYIPKEVGHTGEGRRHLAITVLIYNNKGEVLLHRRKHKVFDNVWDFTASTHPLYLEDGSDETLDEATRRCLKTEWGITDLPARLAPKSTLGAAERAGRQGLGEIRVMGEFNYFAPYPTVQGKLCENEHCAMMVGEYDGEINLNPKVGYEYKWVDKKEFLQDIEANPQKYAPWAIEGVGVLEKAGFFNT